MRRAKTATAALPESGMRLPRDPFNNGQDVADGSGSWKSKRRPRPPLWLTTGGLMRPIATRAVEGIALAVVLFVGIAGQAFAGAGAEQSSGKCNVTYGGRIATAEGDKGTVGCVAHAKRPQAQE